MNSQFGQELYQSGQRVTISGAYQVVGAQPKPTGAETPIQTLQVGQHFPNYEGRAVVWMQVYPAAVAQVGT